MRVYLMAYHQDRVIVISRENRILQESLSKIGINFLVESRAFLIDTQLRIVEKLKKKMHLKLFKENQKVGWVQ